MGRRSPPRAARAFGLAMLAALSSQAFAFDYFSGGIDYWGERKDAPASYPADSPTPSAFSWKNQLDPSTDDFFREGDYLPPRPFMEVARNPTDENIRNWMTMVERKNEVMERLQRRMVEYTARYGGVPPSMTTPTLPAPMGVAAPVEIPKQVVSVGAAVDPKRFRLRLYFDSQCPHCRNMLGTMAEMRQHGFVVEIRQVDGDARATANLPFPVASVAPGELAERSVSSVPVLLIADLDRQKVYRINGYHSFASVMSVLRNRPA